MDEKIKKLLKNFKEGYSPTIEASEKLSEIKATEAVPELIKLLDHEDNMIKAYAAKTLGNIGDEQAIVPLINAFKYWNEGFDMIHSGGEESHIVTDFVVDALVKLGGVKVKEECQKTSKSTDENYSRLAKHVLRQLEDK